MSENERDSITEVPDDEWQWEDDYEPVCPCCEGTGIVNPLTPNLPKDFLCLSATQCPYCEGSGDHP